MTGFGSGTSPLRAGPSSVNVEIRALNHKHQDIRLRVPTDLAEHGFFLEQTARSVLGRGRYEISVRLSDAASPKTELDLTRLRSHYLRLASLRDEIAPGTSLSLDGLLALPDLVSASSQEPEEMRRALSDALLLARESLDQMRLSEGAALKEELQSRLKSARDLRAQIAAASADLVRHHQTRLRERIATLLEGSAHNLSESRLEQEIAILADKSDITEELVRLDSHYTQLETLLCSDEPVGRRLDFLLQEIGREVNTIGSKSQHVAVAHLIVDMKAEAERLREQVQNVD